MECQYWQDEKGKGEDSGFHGGQVKPRKEFGVNFCDHHYLKLLPLEEQEKLTKSGYYREQSIAYSKKHTLPSNPSFSELKHALSGKEIN